MTILKRKILFYSFVLIFLAIGGTIIFLSLGWRLDAQTLDIEKTGAIYIKTQPRDVIIKINNKTYPDESGILQSGTLITNLFPKEYQVSITKEDFRPYNKKIRVEESLVTELLNILLLPVKLKNEAVLPIIKGNEITDISSDAKKILIRDSSTNSYYLYDTEEKEKTLNISAAFNNSRKSESIKKAAFVPFDATHFIIEDKKGFHIFDSSRFETENLMPATSTKWEVQNSTLYFLEEKNAPAPDKIHTSHLKSYNLIIKAETEIAEIPADSEVKELIISNNGDKAGLVYKNGDIYIVELATRNTKKIAHNAASMSFSPDGKKVAIIDSDNSLHLHFFEDVNVDSRKKEGDVMALPGVIKTAKAETFWLYDSFHFFSLENGEIMLNEIDERNPLNKYQIAKDIQAARYDIKKNILLVISDGTLKIIDFNG